MVRSYVESHHHVFFFFKQKTAYEIMPSLVGSEMCIRDSLSPTLTLRFWATETRTSLLTPGISSESSRVKTLTSTTFPRSPCGRRSEESFTSRALSLIHISEPTRLGMISYAVFCLKK